MPLTKWLEDEYDTRNKNRNILKWCLKRGKFSGITWLVTWGIYFQYPKKDEKFSIFSSDTVSTYEVTISSRITNYNNYGTIPLSLSLNRPVCFTKEEKIVGFLTTYLIHNPLPKWKMCLNTKIYQHNLQVLYSININYIHQGFRNPLDRTAFET